jgi:hypothetical protein
MATTRTADQLLADLAELETTQVDKCPAHATHPSLPAVPCRIVEQKIVDIRFNGKVVVVNYRLHSYSYRAADNYNRPKTLELKPTAAVKRQLEKFQDCRFESVVDFKAVLLDEQVAEDLPGAEVVSAAGILDSLTKNTQCIQPGARNGVAYTVEITPVKIAYENGVIKVQKEYCLLFEEGVEEVIELQKDEPYEQVELVANSRVRRLLREAGIAGIYRWSWFDLPKFKDLLFAEARRDKLVALVA